MTPAEGPLLRGKVPGDLGTRVQTDQSLGSRAARGVMWVTGARLATQTIQFVASLALAHLLLPSAYGLAAIVSAFTGFALIFSDLGLGASLVQAPEITESDASTAFYVNFVTGIIMTVMVFLLREPLAQLFGQPRLAGLLAIASVGFTISITPVPTAVLERKMQFRSIAMIEIVAVVSGCAVSITCAAFGLGPASLVIGPVAAIGSASIASLFAAKWLPRARPSRQSARRILAFGGHLTGFNILDYWARNADNLLLGRVAGTTALGLYNRAYTLMLLPVTQASGVLGRVLLPVFSSLQGDKERLGRAALRVCRISSVLTFPLLFGLAGAAHSFVLVAFGAHWRGVIPLLAILALSGPPQVAAATSGLVCQAMGQTQLLSTWGNLGNLTVVLAILVGLPWHAEGVAIAYTIRAYLFFPLAMMPAKKAVGLGTTAVLKAVAVPFVAAAVTASCMFLVGVALYGAQPLWLCLIIQVVVGTGVYLGILGVVDRRSLLDARDLLANRLA